MYKNYFILNRIITEFDSLLKGFLITEIFSQEKDKLILKCENSLEKYIEVCVNPGEPYLTVRDEYHRAGKNSIDFFDEHLPLTIKSFSISDHDRLVKITCDKVSFYFAVRGKHTNFFIAESNGEITSFKNEDDIYLDEIRSEFPSHKFIPTIKKMRFEEKDLSFDEYRKKYPFIGKEIISEAKYRYSDSDNKTKSDYIEDIISEIFQENPAVFISGKTNDLRLAVESFHIFPSDEIKYFNTVTEALNYFIGKKFYLDDLSLKKKIVEKHLERELSRLSTKMNDLKGRIERGSREKEYNETGNLILINLNKIPSKSSSVDINDIYNDNRIRSIKLDPKLSPQRNAGYYFNKAGNEKIAYKKSKELFKDISENYKRIKLIKDKFQNADTREEINNIMKELRIKPVEKKESQESISSKFKHYIIEGKYDVYVGKDSANNDLLTLKFAKPNDYWFHARSVPGSHVVLKVKNTKEPVPKNILKSAASIAGFHSKAKTSGLAPVSYTLKKYVTKKKGMEPGKVALLKEEVLIVKPDIPANARFESDE